MKKRISKKALKIKIKRKLQKIKYYAPGAILIIGCLTIYVLKPNWYVQSTSIIQHINRTLQYHEPIINIIGNSRVSNEDILKEVSIYDYRYIFSSLNSLKSKLESNPWLKEVSVQRYLPGIINITVSEKNAEAIQYIGDVPYFIDSDGEIIDIIKSTQDKNIIHILGDGADITNLKNIMSSIYSEIQIAHFIDKRRWDIILLCNTQVKLPEHIPNTMFEYLYNLLDSPLVNEPDVIDLRLYPKKVFLKYRSTKHGQTKK